MARPPPFPHAPPTGHQPPPHNGSASSERASVGQLGVSPLAVLLLCLPHRASVPRHLFGAVHFHGTRLQRRQRRSLSGGLLRPNQWESPPHLPRPDPGGGRPSPKSSPVYTSSPLQNRCSSTSTSLQGIGSSRRGGIFSTRYPPYLRCSRDFLSVSRARRRMSISSE